MGYPNISAEATSNLILAFFKALSDNYKGMSGSTTSTFILTFLPPWVAGNWYKPSAVNFSLPPNLKSFLLGVFF